MHGRLIDGGFHCKVMFYQCLARKASAFMPGMDSADAEGILAFEA
jgi:hypothetical protein